MDKKIKPIKKTVSFQLPLPCISFIQKKAAEGKKIWWIFYDALLSKYPELKNQ